MFGSRWIPLAGLTLGLSFGATTALGFLDGARQTDAGGGGLRGPGDRLCRGDGRPGLGHRVLRGWEAAGDGHRLGARPVERAGRAVDLRTRRSNEDGPSDLARRPPGRGVLARRVHASRPAKLASPGSGMPRMDGSVSSSRGSPARSTRSPLLPMARRLATGAVDGSLKTWDVADGQGGPDLPGDRCPGLRRGVLARR